MEHAVLWPRSITPVHEVTDLRKFVRIARSMEKAGWRGRPIPVLRQGDGFVALTGSHRIAAASELEIGVPAVIVDGEAAEVVRSSVGWSQRDDHPQDIESIQLDLMRSAYYELAHLVAQG